ncbi:DUF4435 domain-containing protein [Zobellella iuensis]|uniref:DUF4435 domain-containing protein n=1 Tax=Zobellella iuensis TaxID=2803811 RepID=A0ABS1QRB6_9GAMM|nr:DUF4435 domain-containing protein [Zobellella iuensis]MBL1377410.1 DUF4435 domain-containing protein [Zobellella iuensis]
MRSYIDENDKKNEIRMLFNHPLYKDKIICIVEGKSDTRLFRKLLKHDRLKIESIDGKKDLVKVMKELSVEIPEQILAICDADQDHLTGSVNTYEDISVFITDHHDVETLMINSPSFEFFINEYSSNDKVEQFSAELSDKVFEAAYTLGLLRWINYSEELNLKFRGLNFNEFIDVTNFSINFDLDSLLQILFLRSKSKSENVTEEFLKDKIQEYKNKGACKLQVCCGHDLTNIIAIVYRNRWASLDTNMDKNKVESSLRLGYRHEFFANTNLARQLNAFLSNHQIELTAC